MKKKVIISLMILTLVITVIGCSSTPDAPVDNDDGSSDENKFKTAMVTGEGGVNDESFNQSAWEGLQKAEEDLDISVSYVESQKVGDYAPNFETVLDEGNDLIWGISHSVADEFLNAAESNPDTKYAIVDFAYEETPENAVGVVFQSEQASFLAGYVASMITETDKVGFLGGIQSSVIDAFDYGYHAGVKYGAKEKGKDIEVLRQYAESFTDQAKGKSIAKLMYDNEVDVIFQAAGDSGVGAIEAAKEENKWVIGADRDQNYLAPDNVLTSVMKRVDVAVYNVVKDSVEDKFPGGETIVYGLNDDAVGLSPSSDKHIPQDILDKVAEIEVMIKNKDIIVPFNEDGFEDFMNNLK